MIFGETGDAAYKTFVKILQSLKEETFTIQDQRDFNFFVTAMEMASKRYCKREAGEMLNELLLTGENYKFIGDGIKVSIFSTLFKISYYPLPSSLSVQVSF